MNTVKRITLIRTELKRVGDGSIESPVRIITQFWADDGTLIVEDDPLAWVLTPELLHDIAGKFANSRNTREEVKAQIFEILGGGVA